LKAYNVEVEDVDPKDYPDFCDAYISYAEHEDGTPFTDEELIKLNEDGDLVWEAAMRNFT
jgi:hypothetical protein